MGRLRSRLGGLKRAITRPQPASGPVPRGPLSIHALLQDCVPGVSAGQRVEFGLCADVDLVRGSPAELVQVLMDICLGVSRAMPDGGVLNVSTGNVVRVLSSEPTDESDGIWVRLVVSASAPSTDERTRASSASVDTLPLARTIIARYGGTLAVQSSPDWGTTVSVCLPCAAPAQG